MERQLQNPLSIEVHYVGGQKESFPLHFLLFYNGTYRGITSKLENLMNMVSEGRTIPITRSKTNSGIIAVLNPSNITYIKPIYYTPPKQPEPFVSPNVLTHEQKQRIEANNPGYEAISPDGGGPYTLEPKDPHG